MKADAKSSTEIPRMLERLGVPRGGIVMVHSAFRGFSQDGYSVEGVLEALMEYMHRGTLLLPTMSWRFVTPSNPFFDELETPCVTGILAETFRKTLATRRSIHPTHSIAGVGRQVDELLDGHHLDDTPCSANSPVGRLATLDGHIVMMGVSMDCCTLIHHGEEVVAPDVYLRPADQTETYECRDRHGEVHSVRLRRHYLLPRNYWQYQDILHAADRFQVCACDSSVCRGFRARDMHDVVTSSLRTDANAVLAKPGQPYRMM